MKTIKRLPLVLLFLFSGLVLLLAAYALDNGSPSLEWNAKNPVVADESASKPGALRITSTRQTGRGVEISFATTRGETYCMERNNNLGTNPWTIVVNGVVGTGGIVSVTDSDTFSGQSRFYRVRIVEARRLVAPTRRFALAKESTSSPSVPAKIEFSLFTCDLTGSGTASASATALGGYAPAGAFDNNTIDNPFEHTWLVSHDQLPAWLQYDFGPGQEKVIQRYRLNANLAGYHPASWTFEGSNDGSLWSPLDSQSGVTDWGDTDSRYSFFRPFDFSNATSFRFYRIQFTESEYAGVSIGEMELIAKVESTFPYTGDLTGNGTASASATTDKYSAAGGFDDDLTSAAPHWEHTWLVAQTDLPAWLQYDFGEGKEKVIQRYRINANVDDEHPRSWIFEGSNDTNSWTVLDIRANVTEWNDPWCFLTFDFNNATAYRYYRINITASQHDAFGVAIGEMEMMAKLDSIPLPPSGVIATAGDGQITLAWNASSGATYYRVKRSLTSGGPYDTVDARVPATSFADGGLVNGTTYFYVISAISLGGESSDSVEVNATPVPPFFLDLEAESVEPVPPIVVQADHLASAGHYIKTTLPNAGNAPYSISIPKDGNYVIWCRVLAPDFQQDSFKVSVDGAEDIYDVAEGAWSPNWQWSRVNGRGGTKVPLTINPRIFNLSAGVHQLLFKGRESTCLDRIIITDDFNFVPPQIPDPPIGLGATPGDGQISLFWNTSNGATHYSVKRASISDGPYTTVAANLQVLSYIDTELINCTTYYYAVSAANLGGESPDSLEVSSTPQGSSNGLDLEAEFGALAEPMATFRDDSLASAGAYIRTAVADNGSVTYCFTITQPGEYVVWCRVLAPDFRQDSFFVSMDGGTEDIYDVAEGIWSPAWQWTQVNGRGNTHANPPLTINPRIFDLSAGVHKLHFRGREITSLDRLLITKDRTFVPNPAPPSNLTATQSSPPAINLAWIDNSANESGFKIERKVGPNGQFAQIAIVGANVSSFNDTTAIAGTQYFYRIRATNTFDDSPYSNQATDTTGIVGLQVFTPLENIVTH